jgi:hypothetical protein
MSGGRARATPWNGRCYLYTLMMTRLIRMTALLLAACGGGGAGSGDGGATEETPIADRPSRGTYRCEQERGITDHSPRSWQMVPPTLVGTGKNTFLARVESTGSDPLMQQPPELLLSSFDVAGNFGAPTTLPLANRREAGGLTSAPRGEGFALAWVDGTKLRFAAFGSAGESLVPARDVLDGLDALSAPTLAAGADGGFGLVWAQEAGGNTREVRFAVLDSTGQVRTAPRSLTPRAGNTFTHPAPAIAWGPGGYALAWRDPQAMTGGIDLAMADAGGAEVVARHRISADTGPDVVTGGLTGFEPPTIALLDTASGYLAAWTEVRRGTGDSDASSVVRLARLDRAGVRQGPAVAMRSHTKDIDEVEPALVRFRDTVAVFWGRGNHIYICGGCVPDTRIELLLIDPSDLNPVSDLYSINNGGNPRGGGLLRRRVAVMGSSLLTTYLLTFHVHATPGSAAIRCETSTP